jgi:hypothetical protein
LRSRRAGTQIKNFNLILRFSACSAGDKHQRPGTPGAETIVCVGGQIQDVLSLCRHLPKILKADLKKTFSVPCFGLPRSTYASTNVENL